MLFAAENQFPADALHEGFEALARAAAMLGDSPETVEEHQAAFWLGILDMMAPAGSA